ncbi:MAG: hypothetical protein O3C63_02315 [Cyanobacteria bacterium]|nr:hypothetical protein [Cyanobacteriota bacterium]MDA1020423.1 hypothetical protein [Cyanobacteriota bacterium]
MVDDKNSDDKPSFFDFSDDEARSWPPADSHPTEDDSETEDIEETTIEAELPSIQTASSEPEEFNVEDLFSDDLEEVAEAEPEAEPSPITATEASTEDDDEDLFPDFEPIKKIETETDFDLTANKHDQEEDLDDEIELITDPLVDSLTEDLDEFGFDEEPETTIQINSKELHQESVDALYNDYSAKAEAEPIIIEETKTLPFRTFTTYDYSESGISQTDLNDEEEDKPGLNKNVLILLAVFVIIGGWYGFKTIFSRDLNANKGRERQSKPKKQKSLMLAEKIKIPVWDLSSQEFSSVANENTLVQDIFYQAGRANPFLLPDSVIAEMMRAAELELINKQKPNTYRRTAYRATLVGVLTSTKNTIALVNYQEAVFDVLEDTSKDKIIKLATKAIEKSNENIQEMVVGSYIGPWQIKEIEAPEDAYVEPRITVENNFQTKIMSMGRAIELGIFDEDGNLDNLETSGDEVSLGEFPF